MEVFILIDEVFIYLLSLGERNVGYLYVYLDSFRDR